MKGSAEDHLHRRWRAEAAISRRVKEGKLPKASTLKCVDCGRKADHYDHFRGHQHALAVEPVCASCHQKREYKRGVLKLNHHHPSFIEGQKRSGDEQGRKIAMSLTESTKAIGLVLHPRMVVRTTSV